LKVNIIKKQKFPVSSSFIRRWVDGLPFYLEWAGHDLADNFEMTIVFISLKEMKVLNSKFRGKSGGTDILSFQGSGLHLGELVLCCEMLHSQSQSHGLTLEQELGYLLIHGLLHLLGYEHEQGGDAEEEMFHWQDLMFFELWPQFFEGYWDE